MEVVWNGKLPSYWSIANWALLTDTHAVVLFRELDTNRRKLRSVSLIEKSVNEIKSNYNFLIGSIDSKVLLTRVEDARSHDQLSYFGWLDLDTLQLNWQLRKNAIVEKFSIPYTIDQTAMTYSCGLVKINLEDGQATSLNKPFPIPGVWSVGDINLLQNRPEKGLIAKNNREILWQLDDYLGINYQGALGSNIFFLSTTDDIVCIHKETGDLLWQLHLDNLSLEGRTKGKLDFYNETCARNSFIADLVISREMIVWATDSDEFGAYYIPNGKQGRMKKQSNEFLVDINSKYLMTVTIDQEIGTGFLALYELEGFFREHC